MQAVIDLGWADSSLVAAKRPETQPEESSFVRSVPHGVVSSADKEFSPSPLVPLGTYIINKLNMLIRIKHIFNFSQSLNSRQSMGRIFNYKKITHTLRNSIIIAATARARNTKPLSRTSVQIRCRFKERLQHYYLLNRLRFVPRRSPHSCAKFYID